MSVELKCIRCGTVGLRGESGAWECPRCGTKYPVVSGVPRFVPAEAYAGSFGFEWNTFSRTQLDSANGTTQSRDTFLEKTGWRLEELRGKAVLDAGCGMGRFAEVCAEAGADVYAIDLSTADVRRWHRITSRGTRPWRCRLSADYGRTGPKEMIRTSVSARVESVVGWCGPTPLRRLSPQCCGR